VPETRPQGTTIRPKTDQDIFEVEERLLEVGEEVARLAYLLTSQRGLEFLHEWEQAQQNPGG
jgi:hypothetical protein